LSDLGVCLSCHAHACAVAEALREWVHFLRHGLEGQGDGEAAPDAEALRDSMGDLARPLGKFCRLLEASAMREGVEAELQEGWCY
jgi:hypothetical protein